MNYIIPKLSDEKEFEQLVRDWFKVRSRNNNFQNFGRPGQSQHGIDSFGRDYVNAEYIVVQCKNYTKDKSYDALEKCIYEELAKFDKKELSFYHRVRKYYFITSLDNDTHVQQLGVSISEERVKSGLCEFQIIFWDEMVAELSKPDYDHILYQYFTRNFTDPKINLPQLHLAEKTTQSHCYNDINLTGWSPPVSFDAGIESKYELAMGFISGTESLEGQVDIQIDYNEFYSTEDSTEEKWVQAISSIASICRFISTHNKQLSDKIIILQKKIQPNLAFLIGFGMRKMLSDKKYLIVFKQLVFSNIAGDLIYSDSGIQERKIEINDQGSPDECLIIYNGANSNNLNYESLRDKFPHELPKYNFIFDSNKISDSANAYAKANYLKHRIHVISNQYNAKVIHLILIAPDQFCTLLGTMMDNINSELRLYFLDSTRQNYSLSGIINNNTFKY